MVCAANAQTWLNGNSCQPSFLLAGLTDIFINAKLNIRKTGAETEHAPGGP